MARGATIGAGMGVIALAVLVGSSHARAFERRCLYDECAIPFGWDDGPPASDNPPLPQGFALTVPVGPRRSDGAHPSAATLNRYADVANALGRCWDPAAVIGTQRWGEVTLRVSFKRDGDVNGVPRIVYVSGAADRATEADLRSSLLRDLAQCTPLHLSASLGNAIAGQIFAIRFVQQRNT